MEALLGAVIPAVIAQAKRIKVVADHPLLKFGLVFLVALMVSAGYTAITGGQVWPLDESLIHLATSQALVAIGIKAAHKNLNGG